MSFKSLSGCFIYKLIVEDLFALIDDYVYEALDKFAHSMDELVGSASSFKQQPPIQKTAHHLLLHAFTHEFHHKGQVPTMLHLMGHTPKNTNMVLFDSKPKRNEKAQAEQRQVHLTTTKFTFGKPFEILTRKLKHYRILIL